MNEPRQLREGALLWQPSEAFKAASTMTDYMDWLERERGLRFADYAELWRWSVDDLAGFWSSVVDYYEIPLRGAWTEVLGDATMPGARWFDGARAQLRGGAPQARRAGSAGAPVRLGTERACTRSPEQSSRMPWRRPPRACAVSVSDVATASSR